MSLKKMLMLASMALAAIAFAAPATASAQLTWTDDHVHLGENEHATQQFEGFLDFTIAAPVHSVFGCEVTVEVTAIGPTGGQVTVFNPTTETCEGTGIFNQCQLIADTSNVNEGWDIEVTATNLDVRHSNPANTITILNVYETGCAVPGSHLEFEEITVNPTLDGEGTIIALDIDGTALGSGAIATGTLFPKDGPTLGLTD